MRKPAVLFFVSIAFTLLSATSSLGAAADRPRRRSVRRSGATRVRARPRRRRKDDGGGFTEADGRSAWNRAHRAGRTAAWRSSSPASRPRACPAAPGRSRSGWRSRRCSEAIAVSANAKRGAREPARRERHGVRRRGSGAAAVARGRRPADRIAGRDHRADRRIRERHVALRARRREQLQQGADRRDSGQRAGRLLQLQQHHEREPRARGDRPRRTVRALRLGRDGQRDPARHAPRPRRIAAASRRGDRRRDVRHRTRARRDRRAGPAARTTRRPRRGSRPTIGSTTTSSRTRRCRQRRACSSAPAPRFAAWRAPSSARPALPVRPRSAAPTPTRSSGATTGSAA